MGLNTPLYLPAVTLGTTEAPITDFNCQVTLIAMSNRHSADVTVYIKDGQGKLMTYLVPLGTTQFLDWGKMGGGLYFTSGLRMYASVGAVVDVWPTLNVSP